MKLRGLLTLALATQAIVTAAALFASYAVTGSGTREFGLPQLVALLASAAVAVLIIRLCTGTIARSEEKRTAAQSAELARAGSNSAQMTQAVIKTALDAFIQTDDSGAVLEWSFQAEALTGWTRKEALGADVVDLIVAEPLRVQADVEAFLRRQAAEDSGTGKPRK